MCINRRVLRWYEQYKRDLPWRKTNDPYHIWISEIIFQQTRISQGLVYYKRFVGRFPNVAALARAREDTVLKYWEGLGYYSRARNLHKTAKYLYKNNFKNLPSGYSELLGLKGIGSYTAAAIASIAFNKPVALVDGNVYRVLSRYYGIFTPIDSSSGKKLFLEKAGSLMNHEKPGDHNQAMMELGALVCLPRNALCNECPIRDRCYARIHNKIDDLPVKLKKIKPRKRYFFYFVFSDEHQNIYIKKREDKDIWQGLYDFPMVEKNISTVKPETFLPAFLSTDRFSVVGISRPYIHKLTHQTIMARFVKINIRSQYLKKYTGWIRVSSPRLKNFAFPTLIVNYLADQDAFS